MGYSTEVKAVLGIDTSKLPEDARKALDAFKAASKEIENNAGKGGSTAGQKFTDGLSGKIANARFLGTTLATTLGLSLPSLSDKIASAIAGGTAEGWKRSVDIAEQNAEVIEKIIEAHMNPAQVQERNRQALQRAIAEGQQGTQKDSALRNIAAAVVGGPIGGKKVGGNLLAALGWGPSESEKAERIAAATLKVNQADLKVTVDKKKTADELARIEQQSRDLAERRGSLANREAAIRGNINKLMMEIATADLTEVEVATKKLAITQKEAELTENIAAQRKQAIEDEKTEFDLQMKRADLQRQMKDLAESEAKITDRSKLTVGELATLRAEDPEAARREEDERRRRAFSFGEDADLSPEARAAKDKARQVEELEREAERARLGGNSGRATELLGQIGVLRDDLVKSGFTKSTEGDPARALREQIAKDNEQIIKTLSDIATTEKGKYVNQ